MKGIALAAAIGLAACGHPASPARVVGRGPVASNLLRADYAGSTACSDCHEPIYASWAASPMRNMTRDAATASIRAPFDGAQLRVGPDTCTMLTQSGARFMRIDAPDGAHLFRVTKVVGGRYREDFVGLDVTGAPDPIAARGDGIERVLPATYVFSTKSWRYKGYSVMVKERPRMSWQGRWAQECIGCHNTLPLATTFYDELYGPGLPPYQGKTADRVLPPRLTWRVRATDPPGLARVLADEIRGLGEAPPDGDDLHAQLPAAARAMEARLDAGHLVELGIGCEACHNGARAHVANNHLVPTFAVQSGLVAVTPPPGETGTRAQWIDHTCGRCHTVLFSHYPWTWEGGERRRDPGGSSITSGEARDFQLGGCATQLACTACHDPHTEDPPAKLAALATPAGNHVCTTCHAAYASPDALARHSHHRIDGAGGSCIACHMAKKNMGLDYGLDRYHRIGSPTDPARVLRDRPLECALCHADQSVEQIVSTMERWWGKHYDRAALRALYGPDLSVNAMRATLALGKPHEQAVAIATLGQARDRTAVDAIVPMLWHDYPLVRYFAQRALQTITGDPVAIDVGAPAADVQRAATAWLARLRAGAAPP